ncbi:hypothetical protein [Acetobacteroides hydrogenigenes]|nr:hypothetical protein [Acetobacteroides hydrogenigenes]
MKSLDRLYLYLEYKGIKPTTFERNAGFSKGYFSGQKKRNGDFGESALRIIISMCPDMDEVWFITGAGEMLKKQYITSNNSAIVEEPSALSYQSKIKELENEISKLQKDSLEKSNRIIELMEQVLSLKEELATLRNADGAESRIA